jgi:ABC-type iron transport system FetAB ATPase subunit
MSTLDAIDQYTDGYLICDASYPLLTNSSLNEEILLYNIERHKWVSLAIDFFEITGKQLGQDSSISNLSGGQKVILMVILALYSPADRILFLNIGHAVDTDRLTTIHALINKFIPDKKEIKVIESAMDS